MRILASLASGLSLPLARARVCRPVRFQAWKNLEKLLFQIKNDESRFAKSTHTQNREKMTKIHNGSVLNGFLFFEKIGEQ